MKLVQQILLSVLLLTCPSYAYSQAIADANEAQLVEIGGIKVTGAAFVEEAAILARSGLKIGDNMRIPGNQSTQAIRSIMGMRLFKEVQILQNKIIGDVVFLEIVVEELPRIEKMELTGVKKKTWRTDLMTQLEQVFPENTILTAQQKSIAEGRVKSYLEGEGYPFSSIVFEEKKATKKTNAVVLNINVHIGDRVKIKQVLFSGNDNISSLKLRKLMATTKTTEQLFANSKYEQKSLKIDQGNILNYYRQLGFRDAAIVNVKEVLDRDQKLTLLLEIKEGNRYYLGNISFHGNQIYSDSLLQIVLGMQQGDVYNEALLQERLFFSPNGQDISSVYLDNGYLFSKIQPEETAIYGDTVDLQINILEGQLATIGSVTIAGNEKTSEAVIRRELRTKPGETFSRANIIRSQREIVNLGYFDPEKMDLKTDINPENNTVDIEYVVEEKNNDRFELAGSWQPKVGENGGGIVGTIGVSLNNFSLKKLLKGQVPLGDGQQIGIRAQTNGTTYQAYNVNFSEPWLGGKKPQSLSISGRYQQHTNGIPTGEETAEHLRIWGGTVHFGTRLRWPDDFTVATSELTFENIDLNGLTSITLEDGTNLEQGNFNNLYFKQTISRNSTNHHFFPTQGSKISLSAQFTAPYSLLNKNVSDNWLEYHKWTFSGEKYLPINKKLVAKIGIKAGYLGKYNGNKTRSPFERFELDGDALNGQTANITGNDFIYMRGYDSSDFEAVNNGGAAIFNRVTAELRYNFLDMGSTAGYALLFAEAGNAWDDVQNYNPFDMKRSVGAGLRLQVPMFGTIGFDYSIGLDKPYLEGQKWSNYGKFSFILGLNPD